MFDTSLKKSLDQSLEILLVLQEHKIGEDIYQVSRIGVHMRHILDHYLVFQKGYETNVIDYNERNRETPIEYDLNIAIQMFEEMRAWLDTIDVNLKDVKIISEIDIDEEQNCCLKSTFAREALYVVNHTIHHTSAIRLLAEKYNIHLCKDIGIAPATATHLRTQQKKKTNLS